MPKASSDTIQSDPRIARAILSAPYPLATIRGRPYLIIPRPILGQGGGITFINRPPFLHQLNLIALSATPHDQQVTTTSQPSVWTGNLSVPPSNVPITEVLSEGGRNVASRLSEALRPPDSARTDDRMSGIETAGPLRVAQEVGRLSLPSTPIPQAEPIGQNLLTSTFQTTLPKSLLEYRQMTEPLISPAKLTSSTTFFTDTTAAFSTPAESGLNVTTTAPTSYRFPSSSIANSPKKYGQKSRETSDESSSDDGGWGSDASTVKFRSPLTPRIETPSTPKRIPTNNSPIKSPVKSKKLKSPPPPLFLGQTNLSPFTFDHMIRRRPSGSTMSLFGYESEMTERGENIVRVPRNFLERRKKVDRYRNTPAQRLRDVMEEEETNVGGGRRILPLPKSSTVTQRQASASNQTFQQNGPEMGRTTSPTPMSIDPQSGNPLIKYSWPHPPYIPQQSLLDPPFSKAPEIPILNNQYLPQNTQPHQTAQGGSSSSLPFAKACHNYLLIRNKQAAKRRKLLLEYHRRKKIEEDREGEMIVDTPLQPLFPQTKPSIQPQPYDPSTRYSTAQPSNQLPTQLTTQFSTELQTPQIHQSSQGFESNLSAASVPTYSQNIRSFGISGQQVQQGQQDHSGSIRDIRGIAKVREDSKPSRKRIRDISPGSSSYFPISNPSQIHTYPPGSSGISGPLGTGAGPSGSGSGLLPSIEIKTPSQAHRSVPSHKGIYSTEYQRLREDFDKRGVVGQYDQFEFERTRYEHLDSKLLEEVKSLRRDQWLNDLKDGDGKVKRFNKKGKSTRW